MPRLLNATPAARGGNRKNYFGGTAFPLPPFAVRMDTAVRQIELAAAQKGEHIAMLEARRHVNCYLKQQSGLKAFKNRICALERLEQLYEIVEELKQTVSEE